VDIDRDRDHGLWKWTGTESWKQWVHIAIVQIWICTCRHGSCVYIK
jgi:hypothetical protein